MVQSTVRRRTRKDKVDRESRSRCGSPPRSPRGQCLILPAWMLAADMAIETRCCGPRAGSAGHWSGRRFYEPAGLVGWLVGGGGV